MNVEDKNIPVRNVGERTVQELVIKSVENIIVRKENEKC